MIFPTVTVTIIVLMRSVTYDKPSSSLCGLAGRRLRGLPQSSDATAARTRRAAAGEHLAGILFRSYEQMRLVNTFCWAQAYAAGINRLQKIVDRFVRIGGQRTILNKSCADPLCGSDFPEAMLCGSAGSRCRRYKY
jgi:hypothetical protein